MPHKTCPQCAEQVQAAAKVCRFCNYTFPDELSAKINRQAAGGCVGLIVILFLGLSIKACAEGTWGQGSAETDYYGIKAEGEAGVKSSLKDPGSAEFSSEFVSKSKEGAYALCGSVNAKNGFGGYTGSKRFVGSGGTAFIDEAEEAGSDASNFEGIYSEACSNPVRSF
jgi:hypothetical protein